jgi:hypothetical protein
MMLDIARGEAVLTDVKPIVGLQISRADFKPFCKKFRASSANASETYPSPPSKKMRVEDVQMIELKPIGMGPEVVAGELIADINVKVELRH